VLAGVLVLLTVTRFDTDVILVGAMVLIVVLGVLTPRAPRLALLSRPARGVTPAARGQAAAEVGWSVSVRRPMPVGSSGAIRARVEEALC